MVSFFCCLVAKGRKEARFPFLHLTEYCMGFPGGSDSKEPACSAGDLGSIPGSGRSPGEGNTHSNILTWRISWTEELGGSQSLELQRVGHN